MPDRVRRAQEYIEKNIERRLTTTELAQVAHLSPYHFTRCFKKITGKTPQQLVMNARVSCAKDRLRQGFAIVLVACMCGFASQSHMTNVFKKQVGSTPAQFQRNISPEE